MKSGLIGDSGFVGSNLAAQRSFSLSYNSKTIDQIVGEHFDELVIAAAPAMKWRADLYPEEE